MSGSPSILILAVTVVILAPQLVAAIGWFRGLAAALVGAGLLAGGWFLLERPYALESSSQEPHKQTSSPSETCIKCHEAHYTSWHRTYHRTMTRDASPETVKGDFQNATYTYQGITSRMTREGDSFFMETLDQLRSNPRQQEAGNGPILKKYKVDRLVGSHWFQECLHKDETGRYWRLPISYHIVEGRWIHTNGAFLAPDTNNFWSKSTVWNESCVFCHNTKPSKQPVRFPHRAGQSGYDTSVAELGIACEACHGPASEHIRLNRNPARRYAVEAGGQGDASIVNPTRLSVELRDHICAHCHGAIAPRREFWDPITLTDPFNAGENLRKTYDLFWSEAEQALYYADKRPELGKTLKPEPSDGRFWGDSTPLTTALEYNGMALSACYQGGQGKLSCLSCHSMHDSDPNFLLKKGMETNEACYQCHDGYRAKLREHTHHAEGSSGSLCYNCHMPRVVYSLLTPHRSHRIENLHVKESLGTGKPHACNLCHLDKSLGWTQEHLSSWYGRKPEGLNPQEKQVSSALLHLSQSDARTRVIVAGAFSWPPAQQASGTGWFGPVLTYFLEQERFPAVRYLAHKGLKSVHGQAVSGYEYLDKPAERRQQLRDLLARLPRPTNLDAATYPYLPLTPLGQLDRNELDQLMRKRNDPDVFIHE